MPQVSLTIGNKTYRLTCAEGEEPRIHALASHFAARVDEMGERFPRMPSDQLFLMAALVVSDELFDAREELQGTLKQIARLGNALGENANMRAPGGSDVAQIVKDASARLDTFRGETSRAPKPGSLAAGVGQAKPAKAANSAE